MPLQPIETSISSEVFSKKRKEPTEKREELTALASKTATASKKSLFVPEQITSKMPVIKKMRQQDQPKFDFIYDQFTAARGTPEMLEIRCRKCTKWVIDYQKDGPGNLLRCYLDRIYHPSALREKKFTYRTLSSATTLDCNYCHTILANPMIYTRYNPPEMRPAYLILKDYYDGKYLPTITIKRREE